jgi:transposase
MRQPDEVAAMLELHRLGWGKKRLAKEFGVSRATVRRYLALGGWTAYRTPRRQRRLAAHDEWLKERFFRHQGNADVVRQDLSRELGIEVSLRTVERAVRGYRRALVAAAKATVRFETAPGHQLQIDFGERRIVIGGEPVRVYLFVATLGYSRRCYVRAFRHERQASWFDGLEGAFAHFGGVTEEVLLDNARALVVHHDVATREVTFHERLLAFARHWGFRPRACAPYRARTKGKDERGVGYVKHNAIAGHTFASFEALEAHLTWWSREIADVRVHGTTGEPPLDRFLRDEVMRLKPLATPFGQLRELVRQVPYDCLVEIDTNGYSVPWRLIGERVQVEVGAERLKIYYAGACVAEHARASGRYERIVDRRHLTGIIGAATPPVTITEAPELTRSLDVYAAVAGGAW